jgi:hypothetical protein
MKTQYVALLGKGEIRTVLSNGIIGADWRMAFETRQGAERAAEDFRDLCAKERGKPVDLSIEIYPTMDGEYFTVNVAHARIENGMAVVAN